MPISIGGILSGLDTSSIMSQLTQIKRRPIDKLEDQKSENDVKLSAFQLINSKMSNLLSVVKGMDTTDEFLVKDSVFTNTNTNTSDNNSVITLSADSSTTEGSFNVKVNQLALADKWIHAGVDEQNDAISTSGGNFSFTYAGTTTNISVTANSTTLAGLKNAINNANVGVTATIINTGEASSNYKLILSGNSTGKDNAISIDSAGVLGTGFTNQQTAADSNITLDGTTIYRKTNLLTDVIEGASMTLQSAGSGTITFSNDLGAVKGKIDQFVNSYNDLISYVSDQLRYIPSSGKTGTLFSNTTLINLEQDLKSIITDQVPGLSGDYTMFSQIGVKTNQVEGTLSITDSELSDALEADFSAIAKLFTSFGSTSDSRVTFVGFTSDTQAGTYELNGTANFAGMGFSGMQIRKEGESTFRNMEGSGTSDYFAGKPGDDEDGLTVRAETDVPGGYGTVNISLGIAAQLARKLDILTNQSIDGPIITEINALKDTNDDIDDQIEAANVRIVLFEENLRNTFVNLEVQMNKLKSQGDFLSSALSGLSLK